MQRIFEKAALALALVAMPLWAGVACAQQPLRMMVGFPPGGTTDVIARLVAQRLGGELSRSVVVENRAGASGNLAAATVAKADPDGNTLLFAPSSHATNASLYTNQSFDTVKSFRAVGMVAVTPYVLVVNPGMQATNLRDFVDYLKRNPGKVEFASASPGTGQHLAAELFKDEAGVDIMHVPYKGSAAALPDLIAGRVPMMFDNIASDAAAHPKGHGPAAGHHVEDALALPARYADHGGKRLPGFRSAGMVHAAGAGQDARRDGAGLQRRPEEDFRRP